MVSGSGAPMETALGRAKTLKCFGDHVAVEAGVVAVVVVLGGVAGGGSQDARGWSRHVTGSR